MFWLPLMGHTGGPFRDWFMTRNQARGWRLWQADFDRGLWGAASVGGWVWTEAVETILGEEADAGVVCVIL